MLSHLPSADIFREYDIRGVVGDSLNPDAVTGIAKAFGRRVMNTGGGVVCVARDGRLSSPLLLEAATHGLMDAGVRVIDVGLGPTPMLYFAAKQMHAAGGIMITGSHNPPDHNGIKFVFRGAAFYGEQIRSLRSDMIDSGAAQAPVKGTRESRNVEAAYLDVLYKAYQNNGRDISAAWDAGHGAAGEVMQALTKKLAGRQVLLYESIDGSFPAHHPDPTVAKNLEVLIDTVRREKLDLGIAFDGDGDRIGVVDDEGEILWGDQLLMLYAREVLRARPGATIIADVKASGALFEEIERLGGKALMWKTGHSLIKSKMVETGAPLAGEMSGHLFFADHYYGYDDALYAAVRLISLLASSNEPLSSLRKSLPKRISTPEIRFECADARKFQVVDEVRMRLTQQQASFSDVDGVRVSRADGWWLLRASNTQPMLVGRCESTSNDGLERLKEDLRNQLALSRVSLP